jgi:hypothetical protein
MSIITQAGLTSLRSLKYGNDEPGGGSSGEPYVTQKIPPPYKQQVDSTTIWNSDNGLIRGGFTGAVRASFLDTVRIGKFLVDPPRGPLFIAKQIGLQLSNPQLETRSDLLGQLIGKIGPTRIYNLGINTLAQIPITAFGGHITRHGLFPILNEGQLYKNVVTANDAPNTFGKNNRLVLLKTKLQEYPDSNIKNYVSGPGSVDGIGSTTIRRFVNTLSNPQYNQYLEFPLNGRTIASIAPLYERPTPNIDYFLAQGVSEEYFDGNRGSIETYNNITTGSFTSPPSQIDQTTVNYSAAGKNYAALRSAIDNQISGSAIGTANIQKANLNQVGTGTINNQNDVTAPITFTFKGKSTYKEGTGAYKDGLPLDTFNIEQRIGVPGAGRRDEVNAIPLYTADGPPGSATIYINSKPYQPRDLVKFRIEGVNNNNPGNSTWMVFRSYLKDISDTPNPSWNTVNYVGRGEPFYIYNGFERNISFTFQVAAMSEEEMKPMWQKLNYLYSNTMPDYNGNLMRAPYMRLTVGNYMFRQPGIIKSLTYTIDNNSPWEIAITDPERGAGDKMYELPQVMTVQMTYAPIHDFLPRKFPNAYGGADKWDTLPAFVVDRVDNKNAWLTDIFNGANEIPAMTDNNQQR